jgi:hypothetical protein
MCASCFVFMCVIADLAEASHEQEGKGVKGEAANAFQARRGESGLEFAARLARKR